MDVFCSDPSTYNYIFIAAPSSYYTTIEPELCYSPLWKSEIRDSVAEKKLHTSEINQARSQLIVPGSDLCKSLEDKRQERIPLIIIQRPGIGASELESDNNGKIIMSSNCTIWSKKLLKFMIIPRMGVI